MHSLVSILVEYWVNWKKSQMNLMWSAWNFYSRTCVIYTDPPVSSGPLTTLVFAKPLHWKPNRIRKRGEVELETGHIFWRIWIALKKWCTWMNRSLFLCSSLKLQTNWVFVCLSSSRVKSLIVHPKVGTPVKSSLIFDHQETRRIYCVTRAI